MKFLKLRMIYAILRGRTVVYKAHITTKGLRVITEKAVIISNTFDSVGIKNHSGQYIIGGN